MHTTVFEHCALQVIHFIKKARKSLKIAVCWFTHPDIFNALQSALAKGVSVQLIVNYDQINFHPKGLSFDALAKAGAVVYGFSKNYLLHHKWAVADGKWVLAGSFNWTRSRHLDHIILIEDFNIATTFEDTWEQIAQMATPIAQLKNTPPRIVAFAQLFQPVLEHIGDFRKKVIAGANIWQFSVKNEQDWKVMLREQLVFLKIPPKWLNMEPALPSQIALLFANWALNRKASVRLRMMRMFYIKVCEGDIIVAISPEKCLLGLGIVGSQTSIKDGSFTRFVQWISMDGAPIPVPISSKVSTFGRYKGAIMAIIAAAEKNAC